MKPSIPLLVAALAAAASTAPVAVPNSISNSKVAVVPRVEQLSFDFKQNIAIKRDGKDNKERKGGEEQNLSEDEMVESSSSGNSKFASKSSSSGDSKPSSSKDSKSGSSSGDSKFSFLSSECKQATGAKTSSYFKRSPDDKSWSFFGKGRDEKSSTPSSLSSGPKKSPDIKNPSDNSWNFNFGGSSSGKDDKSSGSKTKSTRAEQPQVDIKISGQSHTVTMSGAKKTLGDKWNDFLGKGKTSTKSH